MIRVHSFLLFHVILWPISIMAQTYPTLQLIRPVAPGTFGVGLDANNRVYRAYPGTPYEIHADAVGGRWPYTYSLTNAPTGMTIETGPCVTIGQGCTAGTITWPNPQATASNITVTVTDADGVQDSGTWTITVDTAGYCFIDAVNGNDTTGTGTLASPWQTLEQARLGCPANGILYLRAGTYFTSDLTQTINGGSTGFTKKSGWSESARPVIWIAYPGDTRPLIEFGATGTNEVEMIDVIGWNIWFEGFDFQNVGCIGFRLDERQGQYGAVIRNIVAHGVIDGYDGGNCSFFMWTRFDDLPSMYDTVQNSYFYDTNGGDCALKLYSVDWGLFETTHYADALDSEAVIALKNALRNFTVRANWFDADVRTGVGGNMNDGGASFTHTTSGDIYHNLFLGSGTGVSDGGVEIGASRLSEIGLIQVYRNTFVGGQVAVSNVEAVDGPYAFDNNVIVNAGGTGGSCPGQLTCFSITDYTPIELNANNVQGANDETIVNQGTGALIGSYRTTYLGIAGYELGEGDQLAPAAPINLQVM